MNLTTIEDFSRVEGFFEKRNAATYEDIKWETLDTSMALADFTTEEVLAIYELMTTEEKDEFDALLRNSPPRALMPHQVVPIHELWWEVYLLVVSANTPASVSARRQIPTPVILVWKARLAF